MLEFETNQKITIFKVSEDSIRRYLVSFGSVFIFYATALERRSSGAGEIVVEQHLFIMLAEIRGKYTQEMAMNQIAFHPVAGTFPHKKGKSFTYIYIYIFIV